MADRIPDSLIDDILASTKKYTGSAEKPEEKDSLSDIDALISSLTSDTKQSEKIGGNKPASNYEAFSEEKDEKPAEVSREEKAEAVHMPAAEDLRVAEKTPKVDKFKYARIEDEEELFTESEEDNETDLQEDNVLFEDSSDLITKDNDEQDTSDIPEEKEESVQKHGPVQDLEKTRMFNEVKVHGEYNPNISHNLGNKVTRTTTGEAEPLSSPVMGEEKYRKHFMNKPVQNLEKTQEHRAIILSKPEKTMETPGVIVRKNKELSFNEDGIEPLPEIVPVEEELRRFANEKTKDADEVKVKVEEPDDNQMMFEGFGEEEEILQQSEEEAEAELRRARRKTVEEFVNNGLIFKQDVEEEEERETPAEENENTKSKKKFRRQKIHIAREYFGPKDTVAVEDEYYSEKRKITFRLIASALIGTIMCVLAVLAASGGGSGNFDLYNNNESTYLIVQAVALFICCIINFSAFRSFFRNLGNAHPDINTAIVLSALAGFLQCGLSFAFIDDVESAAHLVTAAAVAPMVIKAVSDLIQCKNDIDNFYIVSDIDEDKFSVENIEDEDTANEIARGLMLGDPEIKYSKCIGIPSKFVELSRTADATSSFFKFIIPTVAAISLVIGVISGVIGQNIYAGISTFTIMLLMGIPASSAISASAGLRHANKALNNENTLVNGFAAVEDAINSNGIIIDCGDAFQRGGCNIEGIKLYHKMRIDEAILYTASVVIESGGVLSTVFEGVIGGKHQLLLPVESLAYEEKLGCSCWIHNHRVLVGNRELLTHHNVDTPDDELESKYKNAGKNVIYLAIEGKISAMFVVVYKSEPETARYIRLVEKNGITLFFRTADANITEDFIEREFRLPQNTVKIINPVAGEMFQKVKQGIKSRSDAKIIHDGRVVTMLKAINAACGINSIINASKTIHTIAAAVGMILVATMAFLSGLGQISAWQIVIYHLIWSVIAYLLPKIKKI
ncbi:MAG: hypothetical protein K5761_06285 [Clostridiales bacterium]|nr:hypothetical protein [Clostridiales bacterium]